MSLAVRVARKRLFDAGWHPSMAVLPVTDPKIQRLLLALNEANRKATMQAMKR